MQPVQLGRVHWRHSTMTDISTTVLLALLSQEHFPLCKSSSAERSKQPLSISKNFSLVQNFINNQHCETIKVNIENLSRPGACPSHQPLGQQQGPRQPCKQTRKRKTFQFNSSLEIWLWAGVFARNSSSLLCNSFIQHSEAHRHGWKKKLPN